MHKFILHYLGQFLSSFIFFLFFVTLTRKLANKTVICSSKFYYKFTFQQMYWYFIFLDFKSLGSYCNFLKLVGASIKSLQKTLNINFP